MTTTTELIKVTCPECGKRSAAPTAALGRLLPCPQCSTPITIEQPEEAPAVHVDPVVFPAPVDPLPETVELTTDTPSSDTFDIQTPPEPSESHDTPPPLPKPIIEPERTELAPVAILAKQPTEQPPEFHNLKTVLNIYQLLLIVLLVIQLAAFWLPSSLSAGKHTGLEFAAGHTVVEVENGETTTTRTKKGTLYKAIGEVIGFVVVLTIGGLLLYLQYVFAMAFIDFVRVILTIEKNTRPA